MNKIMNAKWTPVELYEYLPTGKITKAYIGCSNCQEKSPNNKTYPYCPFCGAIMINAYVKHIEITDDGKVKHIPDFGEPYREGESHSTKSSGFSVTFNFNKYGDD